MKSFKILVCIASLSGALCADEAITGSLPSIRIVRNADKMMHIAKWGGLSGAGGALLGFLYGISTNSSAKWKPTLIGGGIAAAIGALLAYLDAVEHSPENHLRLLRELKMRLDMNGELKTDSNDIVDRVKLIYAHSLWPLAASRTTILDVDDSCLYGIARSYALSQEPEVFYAQDEISFIGRRAREARRELAARLHVLLNSPEWLLEVKRYQQHLEEQERQRLQQAALAQKAALAQQERYEENRRHKEKMALKKYENGLPLTLEERQLLNLP